MPRLTKREKIIAVITLITVGATIFYYLFARELIERHSRLNVRIGKLESRLAEYTELIGGKEHIAERFREVCVFAKEGESDEDALEPALTALEAIARESGIRIIEVRGTNEGRRAEAAEGARVIIRSQGTALDYVRFMYMLECSPSLLHIHNAHLTHKGEREMIEGIFTLSKMRFQRLPYKERAVKPMAFYTAPLAEQPLFGALFVETRRPEETVTADESLKDIALLGVISGKDAQVIIEDRKKNKTYYLREGDRFESLSVDKIEQGKVYLRCENKVVQLQL